jgi:hypothetical protein
LHLQAGLDYCGDRGLERDRRYLLAYRARLRLDQGRWGEASEDAAAVLRVPRTSVTPRIIALVVLGLVRARRGDPGQWAPLEEAWALAEPTRELPRLAPVAAARAEAAWMEGDRDAVAKATEGVLPLVLEAKWGWWLAGELADWGRRAGLGREVPAVAAKPYALQLAGEWAPAAERWREIGCRYEAALALADADHGHHVSAILAKLGVRSRREAARVAAEREIRHADGEPAPRG